MKNNDSKILLKAICTTFVVVFISYSLIGGLLNFILDYSTVEASYHLPSHALIIGLIFTVIFSTLLILDKLDKK